MSGHTISPLFDWRGAITRSDLEPTTRLVALTLSLHMSTVGGSCFPSQQTLADESGLSRSAVNEHLRKLRAAGFLRVAHRRRLSDGRQSSNEYQATIPAHLVEVRHETNEEGVRTTWLESADSQASGPRVAQDDTDLRARTTRICAPGRHQEDAIEGAIEDATTPTPPEEGADGVDPDGSLPVQPSLLGDDRGVITRAERKRRSREPEPPGFAPWWAAYPHLPGGKGKGQKQAAARAFKRALTRGATLAELAAALDHYAAGRRMFAEHFGVEAPLKNASTFLNGDRWEDWTEPVGDLHELRGRTSWPAPPGRSWEPREASWAELWSRVSAAHRSAAMAVDYSAEFESALADLPAWVREAADAVVPVLLSASSEEAKFRFRDLLESARVAA